MTLKEFFKTVIPRVGLPLLATSAVFHLLDEQLVALTQAELFAQEGASAKLWLYGGLSMLTSLLGPLLLLTLILSAVSGQRVTDFAKRNFGYLTKEHMRGFGKVFLWGILLIIPGFWKFLQILFLPFVVGLDSRYQRGELDALEASRAVFKQHWAKVLGLFVLFGLLIPMFLTTFDEYRSAMEHPISWAFLVVVDLTIFLLFQCLLLKQWEMSHVVSTDLQLERN